MAKLVNDCLNTDPNSRPSAKDARIILSTLPDHYLVFGAEAKHQQEKQELEAKAAAKLQQESERAAKLEQEKTKESERAAKHKEESDRYQLEKKRESERAAKLEQEKKKESERGQLSWSKRRQRNRNEPPSWSKPISSS